MKVFVYKKDATAKRIDVIKDVIKVVEAGNRIRIYTADEVIYYNTKHVKTRIYQN